MTTNAQHQVTVVDLPNVTQKMPPLASSVKIVSTFSGLRAKSIDNLLVILDVPQLEKIGNFLSEHDGIEHCLRAILLVDAERHLSLLPQLLAPFRHQKLFKLLLPTPAQNVMGRILFAWSIEAQDTLIADAQVIGGDLVVLSCALEMINLPFTAIKSLNAIPVKERTNFQISEDGSHLHWPAADIHLDLDSIRYAADPKAAAKMKAKALKYDKSYGHAIAVVRKDKGFKQSDIPGLTDRHVRRIETGEMRPTAKALQALAEAHGLSLAAYLDAVARAVVRQ